MKLIRIAVLAALACGDELDEPIEPAHPPLSAAEQNELAELLAAAKKRNPNHTGMFQLDEPEHVQKLDAPAPTGDVEKGSYPALVGWGIKGCLAFQDGQQEFCGRDHCELFGLTCDNVWHTQSRTLEFESYEHFISELTGSCAPTASAAWMPCALPHLEPARRNWTWGFDPSRCPASQIGRRLIREGIIEWFQYIDFAALIDMTETTDYADANILFQCGSDAEIGSDVAAHWNARGFIDLQYALADNDNPLTILEDCESPGYPGSGTPAQYSQSMDMHYTYRLGDISINFQALFEALAQCAQGDFEARMGIRNLVGHEFGHHLGFQHDQWESLDYGIMRGSSFPCEEMVTVSMGYGEFRLNAIHDLDVSTNSAGLDVYDEDLSCLLPL